MGNVFWQYSPYITKSWDIYSQTDFTFRNSLVYARQFGKFQGAIVPTCCYHQSLVARGKTWPILHAPLPVDVDLSTCHKFLWSARRADHIVRVSDPGTLEVFVVLTCVRRQPAAVAAGNLLYEEKVCDILFPGSWALLVWRRYLCLWYRSTALLQRNPQMPEGLLLADHPNLTDVLTTLHIQ